MTETWKPISWTDGLYEISSIGRVRRSAPGMKTFVGKILYLDKKASGGYVSVSLFIDGKVSTKWVHRLVAEAFIGLCPEGMQVNHKDGNKQNNIWTNLEYVTPSGNQNHALRLGLQRAGDRHPNAKLTWDKVLAIRAEYVKGSRTNGSYALAARYDVCSQMILNIVSNKHWKDEYREM